MGSHLIISAFQATAKIFASEGERERERREGDLGGREGERSRPCAVGR
jgi:hypothetical protein